jgi:Tfp pilus assembly protein PilF
VALELGELLYKAGWAGQAQKAIQLVCDVSGLSHQDKARVNLILGWAHRELGKLKEAETFLNEGIKQDPTSPRLFFELGRIYQKRQDTENAMKSYCRALELIYREEKI